MKIYLARQPIFDKCNNSYGYELLYRDSEKNAFNTSVDGTQSTKSLLVDTITSFGVSNVTEGKYAFVNFTKELLLEEMPLLLDPAKFVVEILEDVTVDGNLLKVLDKLKSKGYVLAMDDYDGNERVLEIIPYADIIKVDLTLLDRDQRRVVAKKLLPLGKRLLAEKVETGKDYYDAIDDGYTLFQGYYFAKPKMLSKSVAQVSSGVPIRILKLLQTEEPDFDGICKLIKQDVNITYKLLTKANTALYYRGNEITSVEQALIQFGLKELKRWVTLMVMRDCLPGSDEYARTSFLRATFSELLAQKLGHKDLMDKAFLTGFFSMLNVVADESMAVLLEDLNISSEVKHALLGGDNLLGRILAFVREYEQGDWDAVTDSLSSKPGLSSLDLDVVSDLYFAAAEYTDEAFNAPN